MPIKTVPFDASEFLSTDESHTELLADAFASGDASYVAHALGIVARARGMTDVARETGLAREALYRSLSGKGDPRLSTLLGVVRALGMKLTITPAPHEPA